MSENPISLLTSGFCVLAFLFAIMLFLATAIRVVPEYRRLSVYRLGRYIGERGPGLVFLIPIVDRAVSINLQSGTDKGQASLFMVGETGEAKTFVEDSGEVVINGITWNAMSTQSIVPGTRVRVKKVILDVESI